MELKYHALLPLTTGKLSVSTYAANYKSATGDLGRLLGSRRNVGSITEVSLAAEEPAFEGTTVFRRNIISSILNRSKALLGGIYDTGDETDKDAWYAARIPGARVSAVQKRSAAALRFDSVPVFYKGTVKRYMRRLVIKRSWSYCSEKLRYIRNFFDVFYTNGYGDGFLKKPSRFDVERYLEWVGEDYLGDNATYISRAVSFIREFLDYIQTAEYPEAPARDVYRLIFTDDIPKRERPEDTFEKIKYIPEPVRIQMDANVFA